MAPLWRLLLPLIRMLPQRLLSSAWGWVARRRLPRSVQAQVNRGFARLFGVNLEEAEHSPESYPSLSDFFVRRLREEARTWPEHPTVLASPADGVLGACGPLSKGLALQAKGIPYDVATLLGDPEEASNFQEGLFLTIYLSPRHYHRVHAPCAARLTRARVIQGRLLPVGPAAVQRISGLFVRNERLVALMDTDTAALAVVAVGALNVGSISPDFDPEWAEIADRGAMRSKARIRGITNRRHGSLPRERSYDPPLRLTPGDPLMTFNLGSTVILLVGPPNDRDVSLEPSLREGSEVRVGFPLLAGLASGSVNMREPS